jgi:hypothetical protein
LEEAEEATGWWWFDDGWMKLSSRPPLVNAEHNDGKVGGLQYGLTIGVRQSQSITS